MEKSDLKLLFVLKSRDNDFGGPYFSYGEGGFSSGLANSVNFIHKMLDNKLDVESKVVEVKDGNGIDREIHKYKPTHVIVEALWCPPYKMKELQRIYPKIDFMVRLHSEIPFISQEGIAMEWIFDYEKSGVKIMANAPRIKNTLHALLPHGPVGYLPNYYPLPSKLIKKKKDVDFNTIDIACFGAIRSLKNQLQQACAAIMYALETGKRLRFHVNGGRIENKSEPVMKNLRALFKNYEEMGFELVEHEWHKHSDFLKEMSKIDVLLQVSYTETFNIVAADAVSQLVPIVVSDEIMWAHDDFKADPNEADDIVDKIKAALKDKLAAHKNIEGLVQYNNHTIKYWKEFLQLDRF